MKNEPKPAWNDVQDYMLHKHLQKHPLRDKLRFLDDQKRPESLQEYLEQLNPRLSLTKAIQRPKNTRKKLVTFNEEDFMNLESLMQKYHPKDFDDYVRLHEAFNKGTTQEEPCFSKEKTKKLEHPEASLKYYIFEKIDENSLMKYFKTYEGMLVANRFSGNLKWGLKFEGKRLLLSRKE